MCVLFGQAILLVALPMFSCTKQKVGRWMRIFWSILCHFTPDTILIMFTDSPASVLQLGTCNAVGLAQWKYFFFYTEDICFALFISHWRSNLFQKLTPFHITSNDDNECFDPLQTSKSRTASCSSRFWCSRFWCLCTVTSRQKGSKLNSSPVYCFRLYSK